MHPSLLATLRARVTKARRSLAGLWLCALRTLIQWILLLDARPVGCPSGQPSRLVQQQHLLHQLVLLWHRLFPLRFPLLQFPSLLLVSPVYALRSRHTRTVRAGARCSRNRQHSLDQKRWLVLER